MRVITSAVYQINSDGSLTPEQVESYEYDGPVAQCFGGDSDTSSETNTEQNITTEQAGLTDVTAGLAVASTGDVNLDLETTDHGAVQGAFEFGESAFSFANDVAAQAAGLSERAIETSRNAIATVATGGGSDVAGINSRTIGFVMAGLAAIFILPIVLKRS